MIKVEVNEHRLNELLAELGITGEVRIEFIDSEHPSVIAQRKKGVLQGDANRFNHIRIVVGHPDQHANRLTFTTTKIVRVLLHEIKHLEQFQKWTREEWERDKLYEYGVSPAEEECNAFADNNYRKWVGLITVRRPMKSRLSKLSQAEKRAR